MPTSDKDNTDISFDNFSERFSLLLDETGFIRGRGRLTEVKNFFEVSKTTARNWLDLNFCPRSPALQEIITRLYNDNRLPETISKEDVFTWLKAGHPNPFAIVTNEVDETTSIKNICRAYLEVYKIAQDLGFDLLQLSDHELTSIYDQIFEDIHLNNLSSPNTALLTKLISESVSSDADITV